MNRKVLIDTSFLITLFNREAQDHTIAKNYHKYFLDNGFAMYISTIVIAEFHQKQSTIKMLGSGDYQILPFNIEDAIATADMHHALGGEARNGGRAEYKDDVKLIAQTKINEIEYLITADTATLHKYCEQLKTASMIKTQSISLSGGYDISIFNEGQGTLGF